MVSSSKIANTLNLEKRHSITQMENNIRKSRKNLSFTITYYLGMEWLRKDNNMVQKRRII